MSDYIRKSALIDSIVQNVVITTEEELDLRGEIVDLIKNQPTVDEKEIIRKTVERIISRLEQQEEQYKARSKKCEELKYPQGADKHYGKACSYNHAIEIVKEECEINE